LFPYISDQLGGKACDYISEGLKILPRNPTVRLPGYGRIEIIDSTQTAKQKLDHFPQGNKDFWQWKTELDA
jgi:hypothetical protein